MSLPAPEEAPLLAVGHTGLRCNLKFAALVIVLFPVLLALGAWQLVRAEEKTRELARVAEQRASGPLPLAMIDASDAVALDARLVELEGRYLPDYAFLLDNRILRGRVGYELLMPFEDRSGLTVVVNRGWLEAPPTREELPRFDTPEGRLVLHGEFHVPYSRFSNGLQATASWPRVVQAVELPAMARYVRRELYPAVVRLEAGEPGFSEAEWPRINISPEKHRAYAAQWFGMALALLLVFVFGGTNVREWWIRRRASRDEKH